MSYILDALQRAHAERERAAPPSLHTPLARPAAPTPRQVNPVQWALLALALVGMGLGMGWWVAQGPAANTATVANVATAAVPVPVTVPAMEVAPAAAPSLTPASAPVPTQPPAAKPTPTRALEPEKAKAPAPALAQATAPAPALATASPPPATPNKVPAAAPPPRLSELPDALRRELPPLAISGAVYADNPAARMLIVNNQVLTQGSRLEGESPNGLVLEEIHPRESVFSLRGTRFRLAH